MRKRISEVTARRAIYAVILVVAVEIVGTVGIHYIEGVRWVDAYYFESMLATGQGPPFPLTTDSGKIFASIMAFVSVGSVLSAVVFAIGPLLVSLWRGGVDAAQGDGRKIHDGAARTVRSIEKGLSREKKEK